MTPIHFLPSHFCTSNIVFHFCHLCATSGNVPPASTLYCKPQLAIIKCRQLLRFFFSNCRGLPCGHGQDISQLGMAPIHLLSVDAYVLLRMGLLVHCTLIPFVLQHPSAPNSAISSPYFSCSDQHFHLPTLTLTILHLRHLTCLMILGEVYKLRMRFVLNVKGKCSHS